MCATSTMPMFTTTPMRIMIPIIAMKVIGVPVRESPQNTPTMANTIEVTIDSGCSSDSNSEAITRKISTTASARLMDMSRIASSLSCTPRPNFQE